MLILTHALVEKVEYFRLLRPAVLVFGLGHNVVDCSRLQVLQRVGRLGRKGRGEKGLGNGNEDRLPISGVLVDVVRLRHR